MEHSMVQRYISLPYLYEYQIQYSHCSTKLPIDCFAVVWLSWGEASWGVSPFPLGCGANILHLGPISLFPKSRGQDAKISPFYAKVPGDLTLKPAVPGKCCNYRMQNTVDKFFTARTALLTSSPALNSNYPELFIPLSKHCIIYYYGLWLARPDLSESSPDVKTGCWHNCKIHASAKEVMQKIGQ